MNAIRYIATIVLLLLVYHCSGPREIAGGTTSTENARVCGSVVLPDKTPLSNAPVRIRSADYLSSGLMVAYIDAYTNDSGQFTIDSIATGSYLIEVADTMGNGVAILCSVSGEKTVQLETVTAAAMGNITGTAGGPAVKARLRIRGLERYVAADSQGRFSTLVPSGQRYLVNISAPDTAVDLPATGIVEPLQTITLATDLGNYTSDSIAVRAFINSIGLSAVPLDSVTVTASDKRLRSLRLRSRNLTVLPAAIGGLTFLWEIDVGDNPIKTVPESLTDITELRHLFLDATTLSQLPEAVCRCTTLAWLKLNNCPITTFPAAMASLTGLHVLEMSGMGLAEVPPEVWSFAALTDLSLARNKLTQLPEAITGCLNIKVLHLDENNIATLPDAITELRNLTTLYVYRNMLAALPDSIGRLTKLTRLELQENRLVLLPESITECSSLAYVNLWGNEIVDLPAAIVTLQPSTGLTLGSNRLCNLAADLSAWANNFAESGWEELQRCK